MPITPDEAGKWSDDENLHYKTLDQNIIALLRDRFNPETRAAVVLTKSDMCQNLVSSRISPRVWRKIREVYLTHQWSVVELRTGNSWEFTPKKEQSK